MATGGYSMVVPAYLSPEDRETSPTRVTMGRKMDPKVPLTRSWLGGSIAVVGR